MKLYERVEGATLTGSVPDAENGTPVVAYVRLQTHTGRNFTYIQQTRTGPDGSFSMTVPYATDDAVQPADGGTNSSVRALDDYQIQAGSFIAPSAIGTTAVPEGAIYEGRQIQVEMEPAQQGNQSGGAGNGTTTPSGSNTSGTPTDGSGNQSSGPTNDTASSVAVEPPIASAEP